MKRNLDLKNLTQNIQWDEFNPKNIKSYAKDFFGHGCFFESKNLKVQSYKPAFDGLTPNIFNYEGLQIQTTKMQSLS
jgi:hypothetical protein